MCVFLCTKFQVSSIILTSFRQGELHELQSDYPLAPEKLETSHNMLPNYCISIEN